MKTLFKRNEQLSFTLVAYALLVVIAGSYFLVRETKETYAKLREGPSVLGLYPSAVVPMARQRVSLLSEGSHFGPETTVTSSVPSVFFSSLRFVGQEDLSFEICVLDASLKEGSEIPLTISSPLPGGLKEKVELKLELTHELKPLSLELFNFEGLDEATVYSEHVLFGYKPKGYAPYTFMAIHLRSGAVYSQETESELEHLGAPVKKGENAFELVLTDALGREVRKHVVVWREEVARPQNNSFSLIKAAYAQTPGTYIGKPTQWTTNPTEQIAASDCSLGNGINSQAGGCGCGNIAGSGGAPRGGSGAGSGPAASGFPTVTPPPNDYLTGLGQAEVRGDGVLLHNGQFRTEVVDLRIPCRGFDFVWKRTYQSGSGTNLNGFLGSNWDFSWGAHFIVDNPSNPVKGYFSRGDFRRDTYDNAQLVGTEYIYATLPAGFFDIRTAVVSSGTVVTQQKRNGFLQTFDGATGVLKTREDRYGNKYTLIYDVNGKISRIQDPVSRYIDFTYYSTGVGAGRISTITDFASRTVKYEYSEPVSNTVVLAKVYSPQTTWLDDKTGTWDVVDTWTVKTNIARTVSYAYDSSFRMTIITDGRGVTRLKNIYDANGRVDYQYEYHPTQTGSQYHDFTWTVTGGNVTQVSYFKREATKSVGSETEIHYFDANHLTTQVDVKYTSEGSAQTATTLITRGCTCTLPTAIQGPNLGSSTYTYKTFSINSNGDITLFTRYYDNTSPFTTTAGSDLVIKAYYAAVTASEFGVMTSYVGERAFTATPNEAPYTLTITYDLKANPRTLTYPDTTNPTQSSHQEIRTYNTYGQLLTVSHAGIGSLTTYTYYTTGSENGYLQDVRIKYAATGEMTTTYSHNAFGGVTQLVDPRGFIRKFTVDSEFLIKDITYLYDSVNGTKAEGYKEFFFYNGNRLLVRKQIENKKGDTFYSNTLLNTDYIRTDAGTLSKQKREISQSVNTDYTTITWQATRYDFDRDFQRTMTVDALVKQTLFTFDERGLVVTTTSAYKTPTPSPDESKTLYVFDSEEKLSKTIQVFQNDGGADITEVIRRQYDHFDRLQLVLDGENDGIGDDFTRLTYDLASNLTMKEELNPSAVLLRREKYAYDELNRLYQKLRGTSDQDETLFYYDTANRLIRIKDDNGTAGTTSTAILTQTVRTYDYASRVLSVSLRTLNANDTGRNSVTYTYDLNGNIVSKTSHDVKTTSGFSSSDYVWTMDYDGNNRQTKNTFFGNDGVTTNKDPVEKILLSNNASGYDTRGNIVRSLDVNAVPTEYVYDGLSAKLSTTLNAGGTNPSQIIISSTYDLAGNLTTKVDGDSKTTTYSYDDQNRLSIETLPDGDKRTLTWNKLSKLKKLVDDKGVTVQVDYDLRGNLTGKRVTWSPAPTWSDYTSYSTSFVNFLFDGVNRVTFAEDDDSKVTRTFNSLDQLTAETLEIKSNGVWKTGKTTSSTYDDTGKRRLTVSYPISAKQFDYAYDEVDHKTTIALHGSPNKTMAQYWYEGPGSERVLQRDRAVDLSTGNNFRAYCTYDALMRRLTTTHVKRTSGVDTTLRTLTYTWGDQSGGRFYDRASYVLDPGSSATTHAYTYDKLGRVTDDDKTIGMATTNFDFTYSPAQFWNRMDKNTVQEYLFGEGSTPDGSHQMKECTQSGGPLVNCGFDAAGNMATFGSARTYGYDYQNQLAYAKDSAGTITEYWYRYDPFGRRIEEKRLVSGSSTFKLFYYDGSNIVEETDGSQNLSSLNGLRLFGNQLNEVLYSGTVSGGALATHRWPCEDSLGSIVTVYDDTGTMKSDLAYTLFGETTRSGTEDYPYGYAKLMYNSEMQLYHSLTRVYKPEYGRWLPRDFIGTWGDKNNVGNAYAYSMNPANKIDPTGLMQNPLEKCQACCQSYYDAMDAETAQAYGDFEDCRSTVIPNGLMGAGFGVAGLAVGFLLAGGGPATWLAFGLAYGAAAIIGFDTAAAPTVYSCYHNLHRALDNAISKCQAQSNADCGTKYMIGVETVPVEYVYRMPGTDPRIYIHIIMEDRLVPRNNCKCDCRSRVSTIGPRGYWAIAHEEGVPEEGIPW